MVAIVGVRDLPVSVGGGVTSLFPFHTLSTYLITVSVTLPNPPCQTLTFA